MLLLSMSDAKYTQHFFAHYETTKLKGTGAMKINERKKKAQL